jgi:hypothetical protein
MDLLEAGAEVKIIFLFPRQLESTPWMKNSTLQNIVFLQQVSRPVEI